MAVMKKKGSKGLPPISTASLPDVIFMILFFFMVSTTMRDQELLVRYKLPEATEVQKLEKKSLVSFIHIGPPAMTMQAKFGTAPRIQLNDSYKSTRDILDFVAAERDKLSEADRASMTICLKADEATKMGIVTDVKQEPASRQRPETLLCGFQVAGLLIRRFLLKRAGLQPALLFDRECRECAANTRQIRRKHRKRQREEEGRQKGSSN